MNWRKWKSLIKRVPVCHNGDCGKFAPHVIWEVPLCDIHGRRIMKYVLEEFSSLN